MKLFVVKYSQEVIILKYKGIHKEDEEVEKSLQDRTESE